MKSNIFNDKEAKSVFRSFLDGKIDESDLYDFMMQRDEFCSVDEDGGCTIKYFLKNVKHYKGVEAVTKNCEYYPYCTQCYKKFAQVFLNGNSIKVL